MFAWLPLMTIKGWLMLLESIFKVLAGSVVKPISRNILVSYA